jgi:lysine 2,3-aminomutase
VEQSLSTVDDPPERAPAKRPLKPPAGDEALDHRRLRQGEFWRAIPKYRDVDVTTFLDHVWQGQHSVKTPLELLETIKDLVPASFFDDAQDGFRRAPMAVRVSPYIIASIDWSNPYDDPVRIQFIPLGSRLLPDHPRLTLDSLHEQEDAPIPGLVHRYADRALFLPINVCPVYCRFCTRSYAIGLDTETVDKLPLATTPKAWQDAFDYIASRPEIEDVVISGGDAYQLAPKSISLIGEALLAIPHVRRMRYATKGLAVMPSKILTDKPWVDALVHVVMHGRRMGKEVVIHTHFNHPAEVSWITQRAVQHLLERGVTIRNQTVLIRNVNDDPRTMLRLVKQLGWLGMHPYYVYTHDMVRGVEDLRTTVQTAIDLEKFVRGATSGFNTPAFVCDAPGGGGKRDVHSFEYYDRENGIAVYVAPNVKPNRSFVYFDPIHALPAAAQERWRSPRTGDEMVAEALARAAVA